MPILVGGTGFYYRALTRGLFPGPGADEELRARLDRIADRKGPERLHRLLRRVDPDSADRIMPRDLKRLVRALEVYFSTGRPLTAHFADTRSPIADCEVVALAVKIPADLTAERVARRVERQFERGIVDEVKGLLASGVPADGAALRRAGLSSGDGDAARCARRDRDTSADRSGEPPLRSTAVDLVSQRA